MLGIMRTGREVLQAPQRPYQMRFRRITMATSKSTLERFIEYVSPEPNSGCWLWTGPGNGYGQIRIGSRKEYAHRVSHRLFKGEIPTKFDVDHLCRNTMCVNPEHLEAVTHIENIRRGIKGVLTTHCPRGHEYNAVNTYFRKPNAARVCKPCARIKDRIRYGTGARIWP